MMEKKKWTDDVRERLSRYESKDVPQGLWGGIESALDSKSRTRIIPWLRIVSLTAAAAVVAIAVIIVAPSEERQSKMLQAAAGKSELTKVGDAVNPADNARPTVERIIAKVTESVTGKTSPTVVAAGENVTAPANERNSVSSEKENVSLPVKEGVSKTPVKEETIDKSAAKRSNTESNVGNNRLLADYSGTPAVPSKRKSSEGMSLSMFAANIVSSSSAMDGYGMLASVSPMAVRPQGDVSGFNEPSHTVAYNNRYSSTTTTVNHHQPLSIGLGARYFLNNRWALETGVTYSMLESETESGTEQSYVYNNQKVHYVGVPLSVGYQWINGKQLSVYTSGGVTAEFGVKGKLDTQYVLDGGCIDNSTSDIHDIPMQWSVGVAAGVQYNILRNLGVYVEPGLVYYIDNGSSLETSYSDKPLNFRLKVGLRFDLNK